MTPNKRQYEKDYRWVGSVQTVLNAVVANGTSLPFDVSQWGNIGVSVIGATGGGAANAVIKCKVSLLASDVVDFTAASTVGNEWDYCAIFLYTNASSNPGTTGIVFSGANGTTVGEINAGAVRSIGFEVASYAAGAFTVKIAPVNNQ